MLWPTRMQRFSSRGLARAATAPPEGPRARAQVGAAQDAAVQLEVMGGGGAVAAVVRDRAFMRAARRLAVAAKIAGNDFVGSREEVELRAPVGVVAGKAVDEEERRGAPPRAHEMHRLPRFRLRPLRRGG